MNKRVLGAIVVTLVAVASWAIWASACDQDKQASAQANTRRGAKVTAVTAGSGSSGCTASMAAECKAHDNASASTASNAASCAAHGNASASTASSCAAHGKGTASNASTAGMPECCANKLKGATASMNHDACDAQALGAGMIGAPSCSHGTAAASTAEMKGSCDACAEMVNCSNEMSASDALTQIVPLRNGVMFVYTTDTPAHVRAVQNAMARRGDRLVSLAQSGDRAKLCPECRNARGAIASGKLTRETVNIEGGCMTLVTSSDPAMVAKLRAMAVASNGRNKS